jgi:hypothetical protein
LQAVLCAFALAAAGHAQTQAPAPARVIGEVTKLDAASRQMTIKTDKGEILALSVRANAPVVRVPAGAKDMNSAQRITLADVAVGDRVAATTHDAGGAMEAGSVAVMAKSDLELQRQHEEEDWRKRGVSGIVTAVDPSAGTLTLRAGGKSVTVHPGGSTDYRRYSPDSIKFSDATPGSLDQIKVGDQARVLGDRSADGNSVAAERIVSGPFRQMAGTVATVRAEAGEIDIKDLASKKTVTLRIDVDSTLKKLPPEAAAMLARRLRPGRGAGPPDQTGVAGARGPAGPGQGGDPNQMLDRLPAMPLTELKPGDAVMVSSASAADAPRVTAIMLLAGVEPLLAASPTATRDLMAGWLSGSGEESGAQ